MKQLPAHVFGGGGGGEGEEGGGDGAGLSDRSKIMVIQRPSLVLIFISHFDS